MMDRDLFLDRAPEVLILGETLPCVGGPLRGAVQARSERFLAIGLVGQPALRVLRGGVQPLERDQAFDVGVHVKKKGPAGTGPRRARSGAPLLRSALLCQSIRNQQSAMCKPGNAVWWEIGRAHV